MKGKDLEVAVGFSHPVLVPRPTGIEFEVPTPTRSWSAATTRQLVGEIAANIRKIRKPEPYKGKGIRYEGEYVRKKAGKAAKGVPPDGREDQARRRALRRHARVRKKVAGTAERPRLAVYRSNRHIYAQLVDDVRGRHARRGLRRRGRRASDKTDRAKAVGELLAEPRQGRRASSAWCSIAAAGCTTAAWRPWPTARVREDSQI